VFSVSASYLIFAWTPPGDTPPNRNVDTPINTGTATQGKLGNLGIGTANPIYKLHVDTGGGTAPSLKLEHRGSNLIIRPESAGGGSTVIENTGGGSLIFNPSGGNKLDIPDNGTVAGTPFLKIGDDGFLTDIDTANTLGIYGLQDNAISTIKLGSNGGIISGRNNNIGIGTDWPGQKLDVRGHITTSGILELTQQSTGNRYSFIDFHGDDTYTDYSFRIIRDNSGPNAESRIEHRGTGRLRLQTDDAGSNIVMNPVTNVGIGTENPTQKLDVAGYVKARDGLCIGDDCCSTWKECFELSGVTPAPPAGDKRIFVTSIAYDSYQLSTRAKADAICQNHAKGFTGATFKALIYYCTTNTTPYVALPAGARFWNCSASKCFLVANSPAALFTVNPATGNYLENPIKYNESGEASASPVTVWTGFTPNGSGGWTGQLCSPTGTPQGLCFSPTGSTAYTIHGSNFSKDAGWAHFANAAYPNPSTCLSQSRALYCVEQ
jgi:hypothetical protein